MNITASDKTALIRLAASLPKGDETRRAILAALKVAVDVSRWNSFEFEGEEEVGEEVLRRLGGNKSSVVGVDEEDPDFEGFDGQVSWGRAILVGGWWLQDGEVNGQKVVGATQEGFKRIYGPKDAFPKQTAAAAPPLAAVAKFLASRGVEISLQLSPRSPDRAVFPGYEIADNGSFLKAMRILQERYPAFSLINGGTRGAWFFMSQKDMENNRPKGTVGAIFKFNNGAIRLYKKLY